MYPLKLKIYEKQVSKKTGKCKVYIQYCASSTRRTNLDTKIAIPPIYWNHESSCIRKNLPLQSGDFKELNFKLAKQMRLAEQLVDYINSAKPELPSVFAKLHYTTDLDIESLPRSAEITEKIVTANAKNLDVFFQLEDYIKAKKGKVSDGMMNIYKNLTDHLKGFETYRRILPGFEEWHLTFDTLDYNFYEAFVEYLTYVWKNQKCTVQNIIGLKVNTIGKSIKQLRTFLRDRIRRKIIADIDMTGWNILEEEVDAIYLTETEIEKIYNLDLNQFSHLEDLRDELILASLSALRYSDFSTVDEFDVRGDMLHKKQQKSNHWVVIPLRAMAKKVLERRFSKGVIPNTNQEFNRHGKEILKLAGICQLIKHSYKKGNKKIVEVRPKYAWFSSHTCRRSFCTNEFLAGTPVALIMKISGHKSEKDFYKYIRVTPEEAALKLKEIWLQREKDKIPHSGAIALAV